MILSTLSISSHGFPLDFPKDLRSRTNVDYKPMIILDVELLSSNNNNAEEKGVVSVFRSTTRKLHTTRSWDFLRLSVAASRRNAAAESDMIVGLLDSGIWMGSPSFKDDGYGEIPSKWKGHCVTGHNFTGCNRYLFLLLFYYFKVFFYLFYINMFLFV